MTVGRYAPSPSGRMHLGNLFAALLAWLDVRSLGGEMVLRMEDLDPQRCKPAYLPQLAQDLLWLGLDWDTGWQPGDTEYTQSHRTAVYQTAFHRLEGQGLVYPCFCTRKELLAASAPHASDGARVYDGRCRRLSPQERAALWAGGRSPAWRVQVPAETVSFVDGNYGPQAQRLDRDCGDFILRRSDGVYAYQLAVAADDGAMGITRVCGGGTSSPPLPGRSGCWNSWATRCPPTATSPSSWPGRPAAVQAGPGPGRGLPPGPLHPGKGHRAAGLAGRAPAPARAGAAPGTHRGLRLDQGGRPGQGGGRGGLAGPLVLLELLPEELDGLFSSRETCTWLTPNIFAVLSWVSPL